MKATSGSVARRALLGAVVLCGVGYGTASAWPTRGGLDVESPAMRPVVGEPCDGPDADPWVATLRDRILNFNDLATHAIRRYGPPTACDGAVNSEFDGAKFGVVTLSFGEDVTLSVETFPPEASIVSFSDASGFDDETGMRELLVAYTEDVGLRVDWSIPDVSRGERTRVETYFDAHPGMNASVALHYTDGALTQIRVTLAL